MKTSNKNNEVKAGLTIMEVLVVLAIVVVLAGILMPPFTHDKPRARRISCVNNLKQLGTGLRLFANDADGKYPFECFTAGSTNIEVNAIPGGWSHNPTNLWMLFQLAQNDISSPRVLICPADSGRQPAADFLSRTGSSAESFPNPSKRNNALSYFLALDAKEARPTTLLVGDRNLARDSDKTDSEPGRNYLTGEQRLGSTDADVKHLRWNNDMHERAGNMSFMDGSAQQLTSGKLREAVMNTGDTTNRIWLPN